MKRFTIQEPIKKIRKHIVKNSKKYLLGFFIVAAIVVAIALMSYIVSSRSIFAIEVEDQAICYLKTEAQAESVLNMITEHFTPEGTEFKAVTTNGKISIKKGPPIAEHKARIVNVDDAYSVLLETIEKDRSIDVIISSTKEEIQKYIPEPLYFFDKNMIAGETKVVKKGKAGKQKVTLTYESHKGNITSKKVTSSSIIDQGKKATVRKGNIGLPKGEDWKTYEGPPVFKDGKDLAKAGLAHLGAPYKYGGYSFKTGIDCVQLVRALYKQYGIRLPNNHSGIQHSGKSVSLKNAKKGDIICYRHHMGIYIGDGKMVNAVKRGVAISPVKSSKIVTIRRVVK